MRIERLTRDFYLLDRNRDGKIAENELGSKAFAAMNADKDSFVSREEFLTYAAGAEDLFVSHGGKLAPSGIAVAGLYPEIDAFIARGNGREWQDDADKAATNLKRRTAGEKFLDGLAMFVNCLLLPFKLAWAGIVLIGGRKTSVDEILFPRRVREQRAEKALADSLENANQMHKAGWEEIVKAQEMRRVPSGPDPRVRGLA